MCPHRCIMIMKLIFFIQVIKERIRIGGKVVNEDEVEYCLTIDLGSALEIEIQVEGVPEPVYQWFRLPPGEKMIQFKIFLISL